MNPSIRKWGKTVGKVLLAYVLVTLALTTVEGLIVDRKVPVHLPSRIISNYENRYVIAEGTWTIEGSSDAFPLQTTTIRCRKDRKECVVAQGVIESSLNVYLETDPILEWTDSQLVFFQ